MKSPSPADAKITSRWRDASVSARGAESVSRRRWPAADSALWKVDGAYAGKTTSPAGRSAAQTAATTSATRSMSAHSRWSRSAKTSRSLLGLSQTPMSASSEATIFARR